jgi:hypothetical protein
MKKIKLQRLLAGIIAITFIQPAYAISQIGEGKRDAVADCSACHRVDQDQKQPPPVAFLDEARSVQAPAFDMIARLYAGRPTSLARFIQAPQHPMREQQFLPRDLRAIVRYIGSLRKQRW